MLWLSIGDTTDAAGRYVANNIIGILDIDLTLSKETFLTNTALLDTANHYNIFVSFPLNLRQNNLIKILSYYLYQTLHNIWLNLN